MASSRPGPSVIDFGDTSPELQFQDFSHTVVDQSEKVATLETSDHHHYTSFQTADDGGENSGLLDGENGAEDKPPSSFWEFKYYQNFFDVDTDQVLQRIVGSVLPLVTGRATFLDRLIRPNPDLYGPFWISTTLVFSVAISANIAEYFMTEGKDKVWHYDLHKVSLAATAIYSYVFLLPFAVWGLLWYRYSSARYTLLEIICVYGYSLFVYIPLSVLWLIQVTWLQWMLMIIGASLSGIVMVHTFWPAVSEGNKKLGILLLCAILLLHVLLATGFVSYFFKPPHSASPVHVATTVTTMGNVTAKMNRRFAEGIGSVTEMSKVLHGLSVGKNDTATIENALKSVVEKVVASVA